MAELGGSLHKKVVWSINKNRRQESALSGMALSKKIKSSSLGNVAGDKIVKRVLTSESTLILIDSGSDVLSYDNQTDVADINRNNRRLWCNLDYDARSKIWKAMEALSVVNMGEEKEIIKRMEELEKKAIFTKCGRKEKNTGSSCL